MAFKTLTDRMSLTQSFATSLALAENLRSLSFTNLALLPLISFLHCSQCRLVCGCAGKRVSY